MNSKTLILSGLFTFLIAIAVASIFIDPGSSLPETNMIVGTDETSAELVLTPTMTNTFSPEDPLPSASPANEPDNSDASGK